MPEPGRRYSALGVWWSFTTLSLIAGVLTVIAGCGSGTKVDASPANLVYPQTMISASVGQAITSDTPTVTGIVSSYRVSPTLPAGLSLNTSTGSISGTPTATTAQANYTVTATNATGSTTATLQITITLPAPSNLLYPQTTISASVGQAITSDTPTVTGTVSSYSVSPALPAGLSLNTSTGSISGTPTATTAQANYTVTATNATGSTTAIVTITVMNILLELGHASNIKAVRFEGGRVLSEDWTGHWVFWNYTSGAVLASGDGALATDLFDMAGQTVVVSGTIRALSDGHVLSIPAPTNPAWEKLASDGSYICFGSNLGLSVYTPAGQLAVFKPGDYSPAQVFAAPGDVLVALGPAGQNLIESISTVDGTSTVGPAFSGQFNSWFVDGTRFLTNLSNTVWVYSNIGVQQAVVVLPSIFGLTGQGNWIWTYGGSTSSAPLDIYPIGSQTPSLSFNNVFSLVIPSGTTIGILASGQGQVSVIDLSGPTLTQTSYTVPIAELGLYGQPTQAYAAISTSQWIVGNAHGVLFDGASLSSTPRYFGQGAAWSIAGSSSSVAISTAIGGISVFDPYQSTLEKTINFSSGKLALSSDGSVLGAYANANDSQYEPDRTLNFYSLPSGNVISSFPYTEQLSTPFLTDFTLATSGTTIGEVIGSARRVTSITGGPVIWSDTGNSTPILLSPDGTLVAEYNLAQSNVSVTNIFKNGSLVTAVPGAAVGWIDNDRLLVNQYILTFPFQDTLYTGCTIYSSAGVPLATPSLTELKSIQTVNSGSVYDPSHNAVYSLTTGQSAWTGSFPSTGVGAVSGAYIVYASGHSVVLESY